MSAVNPSGESTLSSEFAVTRNPHLRIQAASGYLAAWDGNDGDHWRPLFTATLAARADPGVGGAFTGYLRHQFIVATSAGQPITSRGLRIFVPAGAAIDELEIYADAANLDSDGDGLPDAREIPTFGDLESQSAGDDADS